MFVVGLLFLVVPIVTLLLKKVIKSNKTKSEINSTIQTELGNQQPEKSGFCLMRGLVAIVIITFVIIITILILDKIFPSFE